MKIRDLIFRILSIVAAAEFLVMVVLGATGMEEGVGKNVLDAILLSLFSAPILYLFVVRTVARRLAEQAELPNRIREKELELKAAVEKQELGVRLQSLINNVPGIVYHGHRDWSISFIGAGVETVTGHTPDEFTSGAVRWREIIHPDDLGRIKETFRKAVEGKSGTLLVEYRIRHKDGSIRWIEDRRQLIYKENDSFAYVDGLLLDITERNQAFEQITWNFHTHLALNMVLHISIEPLTIAEKLTRTLDVMFQVPWIQTVSKGCIYLVGETADTLVMEVHRGLPPDRLAVCGRVAFGDCLCGKAASTRKMIFSAGGDDRHDRFPDSAGDHGHYCIPILSGDRLLGVLNLHVKAGHEKTDLEVQFLMSAVSILAGMIERDRVEKDLRRLATAVNQAGEIVMITGINGDIQYVNPAFENVTGYSCEEAIGKNPRILKSGAQDETYYREMWSTLLRGEAWSGGFSNKRKDGTLFEQEGTISPVRDAHGGIANYVGVMRDVTRERQLSAQLRQSQKMETIGRLAGGIAHDFNNLLTAIMGYSDLVLSRLGEDTPLSADVREIRKAGDRASALTRQLLAFSRMQVLKPKVLDLNDVVIDTKRMLGRLIGENVELVTILRENLGWVRVDKGQIEQVLLNLVVNARDAMPNGGRITVETLNVDLDDSFAARQATIRPGPYVVLTVTDTGSGMDEETMSHIFEPFFTTKGQGKGTGLGLATVYGIVKQSNGYIWAYSEPGRGTTFTIHLPMANREAGEETTRPQSRSRAPGTETILVVDDTELVRNLVKDVLTRSGYAVLVATNGEEALLLCRNREEAIHLLLTDLAMPKMTGRELAGTVSSLRPGIKVLYMSGYTVFGSPDNAGLPDGSFFIRKPFSPADLTKKVYEVLED